jgi:hypothetical protein
MALTPEEQAELDELEGDSDVQSYLTPMSVDAAAPAPDAISTSIPEAFARGAAQELTFGTADEIAAGIESTLTDKTYAKALEESRAEHDLSEEEHPVASLLGGITGGVGQAVGLSAVTGGTYGVAKAPGLLGKAAQLAKSAIMPSSGKSFAGHVGKMAASGAVVGGLNAAGRSEKEGLERVEDVPGGLASGAAIGGAFGAVGKGIGKIGESISKKIDSGDAPYTAKMIRNAFRAGKEGIGLTTMKSKANIETQLMDAAKTATKEVVNTLDEMRAVRYAILSNIQDPISLQNPIKNLEEGLSTLVSQGTLEASPVLEQLTKNYTSRIDPDTGTLSVASANELAAHIDGLLSSMNRSANPPTVQLQKTMTDAIKAIKAEIRLNVDDKKAYTTLKQFAPEMIPKLQKYTKAIPDASVLASTEISDQEKRFFPSLKASITKSKKKMTPEELVKDESLYQKSLNELRKEELKAPKAPKKPKKTSKADAEDLDLLMKEGASMDAAKSASSPLTKLDSGMHGILNASEILGDVTGSKTDSDKLSDVFKMFRNIYSQTKDNQSGQIAQERYVQALENLRKAYPELASRVEKTIEKPMGLYEIKKFSEGASLGESGTKESGLIKQAMTIPGSIIAGGANLLGQVKGAAIAGRSGPIPMASSTMRPTTSTLNSIRSGVDGLITKHPESSMLKFIATHIDSALAENDEGRRAAILNTLMQYKTFRDMFNINKESERADGE